MNVTYYCGDCGRRTASTRLRLRADRTFVRVATPHLVPNQCLHCNAQLDPDRAGPPRKGRTIIPVRQHTG